VTDLGLDDLDASAILVATDVVAADGDGGALGFGLETANKADSRRISITAESRLAGTAVVHLVNRWLWGGWVEPRSRSWVGSSAGDGDGEDGDQASELHVD